MHVYEYCTVMKISSCNCDLVFIMTPEFFLTDAPKMRQADISFALTVVLHAMNPPLAKIAPLHGPQTKTMPGSDPRSQSWSHQQLDPRAYPKVKPTILRIAFLGKCKAEALQYFIKAYWKTSIVGGADTLSL